MDRHPGHADRPGGVAAAAAHGGRAPQAGHRPERGDRHDLQGGPPRPRRPQGPQAAHRLVHLPGPHRRGQDGAGQGARRVHVRQRGRAHQDRHERVHGAPQREPPGRCAARLRRLRGGRPADGGRPPQELLRGAARRDREGAPRGVQHPAPDPGGRAPDRRQGPPGRLPQHGHHHDQQRGREVAAQGHLARLPAGHGQPGAGVPAAVRPDEGEGPRPAQDAVPAGVPEPRRLARRLPLAHRWRRCGASWTCC